MAKQENQKLKLLYLAQIFTRYTDEEHGLTLEEITEKLAAEGVCATRKTLYVDIENLREFGMDISMVQKERSYYYHLLNHEFELAELKLLVDSVQASRFVTQKKTAELIRKIEGLTSIHNAKTLDRQVVVKDRVKTMNESIYYNVDQLHNAINQNVQISFEYYEWNTKKELVLRENGMKTNISPWALLWDNENYYLVAYEESSDKLKHYRVDKIRHINLLAQKRKGKEYFNADDTAKYSNRLFQMYSGKVENVTLEFHRKLVGVVLDRFGKEIMIMPVKGNADYFRVHVDVEVSQMFLAWMMSLGNNAKIIGPESVLVQMREEIKRLQQLYEVSVD